MAWKLRKGLNASIKAEGTLRSNAAPHCLCEDGGRGPGDRAISRRLEKAFAVWQWGEGVRRREGESKTSEKNLTERKCLSPRKEGSGSVTYGDEACGTKRAPEDLIGDQAKRTHRGDDQGLYSGTLRVSGGAKLPDRRSPSQT